MKKIKLPGVWRIRMIPCAQLPPEVMEQGSRGLRIIIAQKGEEVEFIGKAELQWTSEMANGRHQEKSTLTFTTTEPLSVGERMAFVVTTTGGAQYLIGSREGRYPMVEYTSTTGEVGKTANVYSYKVTHVARKSVLECVM